jgi:hypothetical protein
VKIGKVGAECGLSRTAYVEDAVRSKSGA